MVIEIGNKESLEELQKDAAWWLMNLKELIQMMILIKRGKIFLRYNLEYWELIDNKRILSTCYEQPKISEFKQYWERNTTNMIIHFKNNTDLVIPYRTILDVDHKYAPISLFPKMTYNYRLCIFSKDLLNSNLEVLNHLLLTGLLIALNY